MASPLSASQLDRARDFVTQKPVVLIKVELTSPSTRTLYLSSNTVTTPVDGQYWLGCLVEVGSILNRGELLTPLSDGATMDFAISSRAEMGFQPNGDCVSDLFSDFRWQGAAVTVYLWDRRGFTPDTPGIVFQGGYVNDYTVTPDVCRVFVVQKDDWNKPVSPVLAMRDRFPRLPDRSVGLPLPIVIGAVKSPVLRNPPAAADYGVAAHDMEHIGGGQIAIPMVVVDTGRGESAANNRRMRVLGASHLVKSHNDSSAVTTYYLRSSGLLVPIEPSTFAVDDIDTTNADPVLDYAGAGDGFIAEGVRIGMPVSGTGIQAGAKITAVTSLTATMNLNATATGTIQATFVATFNSAADGAGFEMADDFDGASFPISPTEVATGIANPADDLRYALDPYNEVSFARFTYQPSGPLIDKRRGHWLLPDIGPDTRDTRDNNALGVFVRVLYKSSASLTNFKVGMRNMEHSIETLGTLSASTTFTRQSISVGGAGWGTNALPDEPWAFSQCRLIAYWDSLPGARQDVWLYVIGLEVQYRPKAKVWAPGFTMKVDRVVRRRRAGSHAYDVTSTTPVDVPVPPDTEIEGDFFATYEGHPDDGSGTDTGTANALIQRAPDVGRFLLRTYGGQSGGSIESGASTFGSFADARTNNLTWRKTDMACGLFIAERTDLRSQLEEVARAGLAWCYKDRFTGKWQWIPWLVNPAINYDKTIRWEDIVDIRVERNAARRVPSAIKIAYAYDGHRKQFTASTEVGIDGSHAGHRYQNLRDESLLVTDLVNDKIPFADGGGAFTGDIAAGDYDDLHAFAVAVDAAMEGVGSQDYMVCHSNRIVTGYNDKLNVNDGSNKTATVAAGIYTMEGLAAAVATALNAVSSNWTCTYSRTTRKFTVDRTSGTETLLTSSGANKTTTAFTNLGYSSLSDLGGGTVAQHETEEDRLIIACLSSALDLLWASGTNGTLSATVRSAHEVCGFDGSYDRNAQGATRHWMSDTPKGAREKQLRTAGAVYGFTRPLTIEARAIYETDTARELRNRLVDILKAPPVMVPLRVVGCPDMQLGRVFQLHADVDEFAPYAAEGTDGSWVGKKLMALEVEQMLGPTFEQRILACVI